MIQVTIYTRPGCHLCEEMEAVVARVARTLPLTLTTVDISTDPSLEDTYGLEIPVLEVAGRKAAKYRISESELRKIVSGRGTGAG